MHVIIIIKKINIPIEIILYNKYNLLSLSYSRSIVLLTSLIPLNASRILSFNNFM